MKRLSNKQRLFGVVAYLLLGLLLPQPWPASAGVMPDDYISPAELEDIRFIAAQRGWTEEEGIKRLGWQTEFVKLLDSLREKYTDEFAGAAITPDNDRQHAFIAFKGELPVFLSRDPRVTGLKVDLRPFRGYSELELLEQTDELHRTLLSGGLREVVTWYDIETGEIETQLGLDELRDGLDYSNLSQREFEAAVRTLLPSVAHAKNVKVSFVEELEMEDHVLWGGGQCSSTAGSCTTGVMVRGAAGDGLSTAGHCGVIDSARNGNGDVWQGTTYRAGHEGAWGDLAWFTLDSDAPSPDFIYDWNANGPRRRTAHATSGIWNGMSICRFGQTTGRHCDEVKAKNIYWGIFGRTAVTKNESAAGGDSGGPYYYGNNVYGIHKGQNWYLFKWRDWFTPLSNIDNILNVTVVVNPPPPPPPSACVPACKMQCFPTGGACINGSCVCY